MTQNEMDELVKGLRQISELEKKIKPFKDTMKKEMVASGLSTYEHDGVEFKVTKAERISIKKDQKGLLFAYLMQNNLKSCISTSPELDTDTLKTEISIGNVTKDALKPFLNMTETVTLKATV